MSDSLNIYAKIEHLIPFQEELEGLYEIFSDEVKLQTNSKILDVGCGSGKFAKLLMDNGFQVKAIDISSQMVENAKKIGVDAQCIDICDVDEKHSCITAVFDVLNYLDNTSLDKFLSCVANALEKDGIFIADINTLHGFEDIAQGSIVFDKEDLFASIESSYDKEKLTTKLNFFEKDGDLFTRDCGTITQHYHPLEMFLNRQDLKLIKTTDLYLFSEESDKTLLTLQKR